ncbi:hypothetical protein KIN20_001292 [Parelaphostrongylus tenuis]|uniref:Uncharacterized protein n=1 Tax=Parelaphostrongylus tenuis TaxID=148309 RepID=A0AAD5QGV6_PARTN|nr:hypothetical protein KIN20_001292 [Parelaphostrongylus tenuis]
MAPPSKRYKTVALIRAPFMKLVMGSYTAQETCFGHKTSSNIREELSGRKGTVQQMRL